MRTKFRPAPFVLLTLTIIIGLFIMQRKGPSQWYNSDKFFSQFLINNIIDNSITPKLTNKVQKGITNGETTGIPPSIRTCAGIIFRGKCITIISPVFKTSLLVGVLSAHDNFVKRQSVRLTWKKFPGNWRLIFLLGLPHDEQVKVENATHGDVVTVNELERYYGDSSILPIKTSSLYWIADQIKADWILKTDDDSFVDIPRLINVTQTLVTPFYGGQVWQAGSQGPVRNNKSVSYISTKQWKGGMFPAYASGAGYIISGNLVKCFLENIKNAEKMPREDVYSGILAQHCHIKPKQINGLTDLRYPQEKAIIKHEIKNRTKMISFWRKYNIT